MNLYPRIVDPFHGRWRISYKSFMFYEDFFWAVDRTFTGFIKIHKGGASDQAVAS